MSKGSLFRKLKSRLQKKSWSEGFDDMRICRPWNVPQVADNLNKFINKGYHGQMKWLAERRHWRSDPSALWPDARSVIMFAQSYAPSSDPISIISEHDKAAISVYARNQDYHKIVKKRLKAVARWLIAEAGGDVKVFVDTAPIPEKPLGNAAGLGWQGKHTNLVSRKLGNWFFIGSVFTTLQLPVDTSEEDHCGSCNKCISACPTDAFPAPYQLDARRCISYLTIEHKGPVAFELRDKLGNRIYGCDDCLAACPWNKFAQDAREVRYHAREDLIEPRLVELVALNDTDFRQKFSGSPIKRIGRDSFVRNVLYAIGNSGESTLIKSAQNLCDDSDPVVAEAARWAVEKLTTGI